MAKSELKIKNQTISSNQKFDLAERTAKFAEGVIQFLKTIPESTINKPIISQAIRSSSSIGANYLEADCAESRKDFFHKINLCKKEARETTHWFRLLATTNPNTKLQCREFYKEAHELTLIFSAILKNR